MMGKEQEELKRCPFCGAKPCDIPQNTSFERKDRKGFTVRVWCENCDVLGPERDSDAEAIAAWNRRSSDEQAEVAGDQRMAIAHAILDLATPEPSTERQLAENSGICRAANVVRNWCNPPSPAVAAGGVTEEMTKAALALLAAEDARQDKLHELLETIREQIRLEVAPEHRPDGLMVNIQNAVYAMRGRTRLMNDAALTASLAPPLLMPVGVEQVSPVLSVMN